MQAEKAYLTFVLSLGGRFLTEISLTRLEFQTIKDMRFEDAINKIIHKDPELKKDIFTVCNFVSQIKEGRYDLYKNKEGE
jgi:hypothetical protein